MASLGLEKYPWYGQLGVFVLLALLGMGGFYYFYEMPEQEVLGTKRQELEAIRGRNARGAETARQLPTFRAQVGDLEARLDALRPILPEEKDVGELLRRIQNWRRSRDYPGFRPRRSPRADIHAEAHRTRLEGTYPNLGIFLDRVSRFPRIINIGSGHPRARGADGDRHPGRVHRDHVRAGDQAPPVTGATINKRRPGRRRRQMTRTLLTSWRAAPVALC